MRLTKVRLKGFRNFKNATINFNPKTLVIGANDIGKTNLIWAIRLLLDRSLSDFAIEPKDSDFYAYEDTNQFAICLYFENVVEDCIVAKLKGKISADDKLHLAYVGKRDPETGAKSYQLFAGHSMDALEEIEDRFYRRVLNIKYIGSKRDLYTYINREKNHLLQSAKENRTEHEKLDDDKLYTKIKGGLASIDEDIPKLNYIASATDIINDELQGLSIHHKNSKIIFDTNTSDIDSFINNVSISSKNNEKNVLIGGDGRLNQIYLALWTSRNELAEENIKEVSIVCIEEPEAHLHPHQQRKLAEYLNSKIHGQVILTSHSPQIACEFSPNSIVRLFSKELSTHAASKGCSQIIDEAFEDFGYRLSIIPAEAFFSDTVLLIEGPSEELLYKTLAPQIGVDLDRLNISILNVDGIGFKSYVNILNSLEIPWVMRTDNDIMKVPNKDEFRFAGVQRSVDIYNLYCEKVSKLDTIISSKQDLLKGFPTRVPPQINIDAANLISNELETMNIFISKGDLEKDLVDSEIYDDLKDFFGKTDKETLIKKMQERKAIHMYSFLKKKKLSLSKLSSSKIAKPLLLCKKIIENGTN